ncbi:cornifelin homolog B-like isoform X1 [Melanotaenia boesemani]|uniref:cornifelin homolog B-like isoform X1 n=1 Tax=Melanotaenia boesemani TaxID=1250792 RepID=UPI001C0560B0|nr:cornifelin homolog B-like isoform X1 [Melanotaenia boesemani]
MSWVVSTQPQTVSTFNAAADWSSGICDCCQDMNQCCFAFWCFPCFACKTSKDFGQCLCLPLLDVFGCFIHPITMSMRVSMRHVYGIRVRMHTLTSHPIRKPVQKPGSESRNLLQFVEFIDSFSAISGAQL